MAGANSITQALEQAVAEGVFPGAVVWVRCQGTVVYHEAIGRTGYSADHPATQVGTIYDLASLTKPLATATAILSLIEDQRVGLDQPVEDFLDELKGRPLGLSTIRQLLHHSSGLPAWRPYFRKLAPLGTSPRDHRELGTRKAAILAEIGQEELEYPPDTKSVYSDLGFMVLGFVIERGTGESLANVCRNRMYRPLGVNPLCFIDAEGKPVGGEADLQEMAPTEEDSWRGRLLRGEVDDENGYALGGIAGHAGLFGTAAAVGAVGGAWLQSVLGRSPVLPPRLAKMFVTRQETSGSSSWGLGWDTPTWPSSSGKRFSPHSFGHLGYTGTSLWIDPQCELEVVLLSNRIHPTRSNNKIQAFRPKLHDVIYRECMGDK